MDKTKKVADEMCNMLERIFEAEFGFGCWPKQEEIVELIDNYKTLKQKKLPQGID
jgi:hypothetical protein